MQWGDRFEFWHAGVIANLITHAKYFVNRFRGLGVLTPWNFTISIKLGGRSYNSVSTAVLHCDYTLCLKKNDNDVPRYNFNAHQLILIIFGRYIAEWICY